MKVITSPSQVGLRLASLAGLYLAVAPLLLGASEVEVRTASTLLAVGRQLPSGEITPHQLWTDFLGGLERPELADYYDLRFARVKFDDRFQVRLRQGELTDIGFNSALDDVGLSQALAELDGLGVRWLRGARSVSEEEVESLRREAEVLSGKLVPDLNNVYLAQVPEGMSAAVVVRALHGQPGIDYAIFVPVAQPAPQARTVPCIPDFTDLGGPVDTNLVFPAAQYYLSPSASGGFVGIDAFYAWESIYGDGRGVQIVDVEYNFNAQHVDLPAVEVLSEPGLAVPFEFFKHHGTAVLGILGGRDNGFGVTGIAHGATFKFTSEWRKVYDFWGRELPGVGDRFDAIIEASANCRVGDIIVLEMQTAGADGRLAPAEWDRAVYDATLAAVGAGRVVVAAAGNGGANLDAPIYSLAVPGWDPGEGPFQARNRSGAILVGGGVPSGFFVNGVALPGLVPTTGAGGTTFGSRLDLHGWGQLVATTGYGNIVLPGSTEPCLQPMNGVGNSIYTGTFNGTSSATPIVAGAAAVIQSTFKNARGRAATAAEIRNILVSTGTPQQGGNNIGPLPDLRAALESLADPAVLNPPAPTVDPPFGTQFQNVLVRLGYSEPDQNFDNTLIRYTLDGSEPTLDSFQYVPEFDSGIFLRRTVTLTARTFRRDAALQRWFGGEAIIGTYEFTRQLPSVRFLNHATGVEVQPNDSVSWPFGLRLESDVSVSGARIRYSLGPWDELDALDYTTPIQLETGYYLVTAKTYADGFDPSEVSGIGFNVFRYEGASVGGEFQAGTPSVSPPGGVYPAPFSVTLIPPNFFTSVRFTLDGTDPDELSPLYGEPIPISGSTLLRARSFAPGTVPSEVVTHTYTILGSPPPPSIAPEGGGFLGSVNVTVFHPEPEVVIRYTINGAEPGYASPVYSAPVTLNPGVYEFKARAFLPGAAPSTTASASFTVYDPASDVQPPIILPRATSQTLIFTLAFEIPTQGASVHYTINDPDFNSLEVTAADPRYDPTKPPQLGALPGGESYLIRARCFKDGAGSLQVQKNYTVFWPFDAEGNRLEVADVTIEPGPGTYHDAIQLTFRAATPSVQFHYTLDGSEPLESPASAVANNQSGPFQASESFGVNLSRSAIVDVVGTRLGYFPSSLAEAEYVLRCATPVFAVQTSGTGSAEVTFETETRNAVIRYTTDGSDPDTNSSQYTEPLVLGEGRHLVQARAYRANFEPSEVASLLQEVEPPLLAPAITLQPESLTAAEGTDAVLRVEALGYPIPTYDWKRKGLPLGETDARLVLRNLRSSDAGVYTVTVSNLVGTEDSQEAVLVVTSAIESWRQRYFGTTSNEGEAANQADPDGDWSTNLDEFHAGTDPIDAESVLQFRGVVREASQSVFLDVATESDRRYQLFVSFDLVNWQPLGIALDGTGSDLRFEVEAASLEGQSNAYFRIEVKQPSP